MYTFFLTFHIKKGGINLFKWLIMKEITALQVSYKLLSRKNMFSFELRELLSKEGYEEEEIEKAIGELKKYGYLQDERLLDRKIEKLSKQYGPFLIKKMLQHQFQGKIENVSSRVEEIITPDLQKEAILLLTKKASKKDKKKVLSNLLRKGFDQSLCLELLQVQIW